MTRVRVREYAVVVAIHTIIAAVALVTYSDEPTNNTGVVVIASIVSVYATYTTERRERVALLVDYQLALAHEAARNSGP